jgi:branched-chain amino acid transport system substrate-binding protein
MHSRSLWKVAGLLAALMVALGAAAIVAAVRAESGAAGGREPVRVGIIYSRTGLLSAYGKQYLQGLQLGLRYATKGTNRVNGRRIQITAVDDGTDPAKAVPAARDLIGQGYKIIGGSVSSGVALQVATLAAQNRVLNISGPAATDAITGANRYTFRSGRQSTQDVLAIKGILGRGVGKKIVVFAQDTAFGQGNVAAVRQHLGGGGHRVESILVPASANDFTPFAQRLRNEDPDLAYIAWAGTTAPAMWRALQQQGVLRSTKIATGLAERATWGAFPTTRVSYLVHYIAQASKSKPNRWLRSAMRRQGQAPDLFTPDGFVAAQMIVRAIQRGGGENVDRMIRALEGWQFVGPKGVQRIRAADHAMLQPMFQVRLKGPANRRRAEHVKTFGSGVVSPPVRPFGG